MKFTWTECETNLSNPPGTPGWEMWVGDRDHGFMITTIDGAWWAFHKCANQEHIDFAPVANRKDGERLCEAAARKVLQ